MRFVASREEERGRVKNNPPRLFAGAPQGHLRTLERISDYWLALAEENRRWQYQKVVATGIARKYLILDIDGTQDAPSQKRRRYPLPCTKLLSANVHHASVFDLPQSRIL